MANPRLLFPFFLCMSACDLALKHLGGLTENPWVQGRDLPLKRQEMSPSSCKALLYSGFPREGLLPVRFTLPHLYLLPISRGILAEADCAPIADVVTMSSSLTWPSNSLELLDPAAELCAKPLQGHCSFWTQTKEAFT